MSVSVCLGWTVLPPVFIGLNCVLSPAFLFLLFLLSQVAGVPRPSLFIGTEDPTVLQEAAAWAVSHQFTVQWTNVIDRATLTACLPHAQQSAETHVPVHHELEYLSMVLNLDLALRCDAWVCTLASNTCRLMDELRWTIAAKARRTYADIGPATCLAAADGQFCTTHAERQAQYYF